MKKEKHSKILDDSSNQDELMDFKHKLAKSLRRFAFAGVVFSTVAAVLSMITIPMLYCYLQTVQSVLRDELDFCKIRSNDLWLSMSLLKVQKGFPVQMIERKRRAAIFIPIPGQQAQIVPGETNLFAAPTLVAATGPEAGGYFGIAYPQPPQQPQQYPGGAGDYGGPIQPPSDNYGEPYEQPAPQTCTCQIGKPGKPGKAGKDGKDGKDGQPGKPGTDGKSTQTPGPTGAPPSPCDCPATGAGKPGPAGPKGPKGEPGPAGPDGSSTPAGPGPEGPPGRPGPPGNPSTEKGPVGDPGKVTAGADTPGPAGTPGTPGTPGPPGPDGPAGKTGGGVQPGPAGDPGEKGPPGRMPPAGPPGPKGLTNSKTECGHCPPPRTAPGY